MVMSGITRSFGIFFTALVDEFHGSASLTSFASGLRLCMYTFISPFTVYIADRFSDRLVIMIGGTILCLSSALIFPAPNLIYVVICVGVNGIGSAFVIPCFEAVIGKYFRKRISLATTFGFCGSSVGQMSLPYLIIYLIREYGLRGMMLIYGGVLFQVAIFGALIRAAPKPTDDPRKSSRDFAPLLQQQEGTKNLDIINDSRDTEECSPTELHLRVRPDNEEYSVSQLGANRVARSSKRSSIRSISSSMTTTIGDLDICLTSSIPELGSAETTGQRTAVNIKAIFAKIFDCSLIKDARFILYAVARTLATAGFVAQITYLVPFSIENGHSLDSTALLLSIGGGAEIFGRISLGFLADCKPIGPVKLMIAYTLIIGTANVLVAFASAYAGLVAYAVAYGLWGSGGHLLTGSIISVFFDRSRIPSAVGLTFLIGGVSVAGSIALMGAIKDATGSYQGIFFMCAAFQYMASALMVVALYIDTKRHRTPTDGQDDDVTMCTERKDSVVRSE